MKELEMKNPSKLTLVGAGPGDPELITMKGVKVLQTADVVLYDALADEQLLEYCKPGCVRIYVGKKLGQCTYTQDAINHLIIHCAEEYGHVVRLKGGDPFVFGRAAEEIAVARTFHIPVHIVPGVSSALAVPGMEGIPITARGISESFWVTTGTTRTGGISADISLAARSTATVIILMAMSKLKEICSIFSQADKGETAAAVIMNGTRDNKQVVISTVNNLYELAAKAGLSNPSVIIIGEVVKLHPEYAVEIAAKMESY